MSAAAIIRAKLVANAALTAVVPAARIVCGTIPLNSALPAISISELSQSERTPLDMTPRNMLATSLVTVTVLAKMSPDGSDYAGLKAALELARLALPNTYGAVGNYFVDSILPSSTGPDFEDLDLRMLSQSKYYTVKFIANTANPVLLSAASRKNHGQYGDWDIPIDISTPISGAIDVECRTNLVDHQIVFNFDRKIVTVGSVSSVDSTAAAFGTATARASNNSVIVTISGAPDQKRAVISVSGVNGNVAASVNVGFLIGDVTNTRGVNATDVSAVRARDHQPITNITNARCDVDCSGVIISFNAGDPDLILVQANSLISI